ncbi:MAG: Era-like GTP-binding protein [Candidatus Thiodiazotropha sp.]|nr:50S ribosome-binding GTPase [Candidatus Thiodiazotropha sp. (ex Lucina pensylvanica)]MBV2095651.1 50S ribosome-binding GTPase [Candidatus Thiodiazotropha sp. (ex Codakia orbicularis)]
MTEQQPPPSRKRLLRLLLVVALLFLSLLALLLVLQLTESALSVWQILDQLSPLLLAVYAIGLFGFALLVTLLSWLLLRPKGRRAERRTGPSLPGDREALAEALAQADGKGVDTAGARQELQELDRRRDQLTFYVAFFGAVSAGKSALIRAITGAEGIAVDVRAGTTRQIAHYRYHGDPGVDLQLTDAPGILDIDPELVRIAREEARRAQLVIYVCDGELTRDQHRELVELQTLERPLILALNKQDRYSDRDLEAVVGRLRERLPEIEVIPVQAGGKEEVIRLDASGSERRELRDREARIEGLMAAIEKRIATEREGLDARRDESLVRLGGEKLHQATQAHRRQQGEKLVRDYTAKAMLGAVAAVSPGTDILIQGYLGVQMVKALTALYEVKAKEVDVEHFIDLASQNLGKRMTLVLAMAGNVLKAFPGVGTVTGGLMHAVAYGLIFEGLGKAVLKTLEESGSLQTLQALDYFEEAISGDLEGRAKYFARLALEEFRKRQ